MKQWLVGAASFIVLGLAGSSTKSFPQASSQLQAPRYSPGPLTDYDGAQPKSNDALRFRRGQRHTHDATVPELGEDSEALEVSLPGFHMTSDALPCGKSDAVVVGKVKSGHAYLSNDKRDVYSEFQIELQELITSPSAPYLKIGETIDIERRGGVIKLPSGKTLVRGAIDHSMPQTGGRYLLFLKFGEDSEDYSLTTGYQFEGGRVFDLDDPDYKPGNSIDLTHPLREVSDTEGQFLARVNAACAQKRGGTK
jgi:hypothetical protein